MLRRIAGPSAAKPLSSWSGRSEHIGEEEHSHLGDFIEDHSAPNPSHAAVVQLGEQVEDVLGTLTERERRVM